MFLTNNSYPRRSDHIAKLERLGIPTPPEDLLSSAMTAALLLERGERALVLGGPGVIEELDAAWGRGRQAGRGPRRRCRGRGRRRHGPVVRLLVTRSGYEGAPFGCPPDRDQRRRDLPGTRRRTSRCRVATGRRGTCRPGCAHDRRETVSPDRRPRARPDRRRRDGRRRPAVNRRTPRSAGWTPVSGSCSPASRPAVTVRWTPSRRSSDRTCSRWSRRSCRRRESSLLAAASTAIVLAREVLAVASTPIYWRHGYEETP